MALSLICPTKDPAPWLQALQALEPELDLRVWPQDEDRREVSFVVAWNAPQGVFLEYPELRAISSMGAGVDTLLADRSIPESIAISRIVDPHLVEQMVRYVLSAVLTYGSRLHHYWQQQQRQQWQPLPQCEIGTVGILGLGQIGSAVARRCTQLGLTVAGWSRRPKQLEQVATYAGQAQLSSFLGQAQVLICLLPLTPETAGILNYAHLSQLPQGAYLINAARGGHLVEADLLRLLDRAHLAGACLDVFTQEPLPSDHPFWQRPEIIVTPHSASLTSPAAVAPQLLENYRRVRENLPLLNPVSRRLGY